ncbi:hypothetical protein IQ255_27430 [Pleurocapsales cyanobacterium LEGE 10410]|nr:hypothetical protein [Pleurocapsales cyanobacterium LEGE 10410]
MLQANCNQDHQTQVNASKASEPTDESHLGFNIQIELENLENLILDGTHIPLTELAILDQDLLLEQLERIKENLPRDIATAIEIANHKQQIITDAESYAYLIVKSAEEKASQILQESAIVRQAELDGAKIRLKTESECQELKQKTQNEIEQLRQNAIAECEAIQIGADSYADGVLGNLEHRLQEMLFIVQNGRQQLDRTEQE